MELVNVPFSDLELETYIILNVLSSVMSADVNNFKYWRKTRKVEFN